MVEIDQRVVETSKVFLPGVASGFDDPRTRLIIDDGINYVHETKQKYDVVLVDSSDPVGPAVQLYSRPFYQDVYRALADDGMLVVQSESPPVLWAVVCQHCWQSQGHIPHNPGLPGYCAHLRQRSLVFYRCQQDS